MRPLILFASIFAVAAPAAAAEETRSLFSLPRAAKEALIADARDPGVLVQIHLDRSRHSPGVIDGIAGGNTRAGL